MGTMGKGPIKLASTSLVVTQAGVCEGSLCWSGPRVFQIFSLLSKMIYLGFLSLLQVACVTQAWYGNIPLVGKREV